MYRHFRTTETQPLARWREACVDGVLHVAYAAAVAAESAAHRCVESLDSSRTSSRKRGRRLPLARGKRPARRPSNGRVHHRRRGG